MQEISKDVCNVDYAETVLRCQIFYDYSILNLITKEYHIIENFAHIK